MFAALFIGMSTLYTATTNSAETIRDAQRAQDEHHRTVQETQVEVVEATWNTTSENLTLAVNNTGETTLSVRRVDVVVDGTYVASSDFERREVEGHSTDVWRPGDQLVLEDADTVVGVAPNPDRVKFVSGPGVAATNISVAEVSA